VLFGLVGGVAADQQDRRHILIWTQFGMMISTGVLMVTTFHGSANMPLIYGVTFLSSAISAISNPSKQALIPALVPRRELIGASAVINLSMQIATVVGPAVGGLLIGAAGIGWAYLIDMASFLAVISAVLMLKARPDPVPIASRGFAAAFEGIRFLMVTPILLTVMLLDFVATFFGASTTLMPIFAEEVHDVGAEGLGLLLSSAAVGSVIGGVALGWLLMPARPGKVIVVAILAYGACIAGFGLAPTMPLAMLFLACSGAADSISMAMRHSIRNLVTPDEFRGRVAATHSTFAQGGPQLGELNAGAWASFVGAPAAVALGGTLTVVSCLIAAKKVPALVRYRADLGD
jgi:MFS family permease